MLPTPPQSLPLEDPLQLALRLKQGDESALQAVLQTLGPKVEGGLKKRHPGLRAEDLEDVLSMAGHRLWQSRSQYDPARGSLASWFFIIADNLARDLLRKDKHHPEIRNDLHELPDHDGRAGTEEAEGPGPEQGELNKILQRLPHVDHQIIWVYACTGGQGPWAADLAADLGLSAGAIRVRCHRIKEKIRKEMASLGNLGAFAQVSVR